MNTIDKITSWGDAHHAGWLDLFRVLLGAFLFYKGIQFGNDPHEIKGLMEGGHYSFVSFAIIQYIPMVHLFGGLMIAIGFKTRWAVAFQLPILAGAITLNLLSPSPLEIYSQFLLSLSVFMALALFLVYGSGPYSVDEYFRKNEGG